MKKPELVIYIHGAASGVLQDGDIERGIAEDNALAEANIRALRESGVTVIRVGDARDGFTLNHYTPAVDDHFYRDLASAVRDYPHATTLILDAHGSEEPRQEGGDDLCHILCGPKVEGDDMANGCFAGDLFKVIADNGNVDESGQERPVNFFMLCCGSRKAPLESDALPLGSTLVAFTSPDTDINDLPRPAGFRVQFIRGDSSFAEQLCLNMQYYGLPHSLSVLEITVVQRHLPADARAYSMWDQAFASEATEPHGKMPADFVKTMHEACPELGPACFNKLMAALKLQAEFGYPGRFDMDMPGSPVKMRMNITPDLPDFRKQIAKAGLSGALGVYAYRLTEMHEERPLGAFQTQPWEFYATPAPALVPARPNQTPTERLAASGALDWGSVND